MTAIVPVTVPDESLCLKDYLIFRVDVLEGCRELSGESALEMLSRELLMHTLQRRFAPNTEKAGLL